MRCFFCRKPHTPADRLMVARVWIASGREEDDTPYGFCADCLQGMTAAEFWRRIAVCEAFGVAEFGSEDGS